jgi:predicted AMP nucleosidase
MPNVTADGITLINFGMGSPNAATVMDLLSAIAPKAVLFLGKCGGLKRKNQIGDLILPIAAIRGEGTSNDYLPPEVPALPAFQLQRAVSTMIRDLGYDYWTGTVYTTNRRVWEHDDRFRDQLRRTRSMAIDMETATIFAAGQPHFDWCAASCVRSANDPRGGEDRSVGSGGDCELRRKAYQNRDRGLEACAAPWPQRQAFAFRR